MLSASILVKEAAPTRTKISDIELNKCQAYVGRSAKTSRAAIRCEAEGDWVSWNRAWGSSIQFSAPQTCQCIHTRKKKKKSPKAYASSRRGTRRWWRQCRRWSCGRGPRARTTSTGADAGELLAYSPVYRMFVSLCAPLRRERKGRPYRREYVPQ